MPRAVIALITDFGTSDYYVGALKGTLLRLAPKARIVDITHDVAAGDVEEGAFLVGACHRHFPPGTVFLAVIDPGVGSERRILAGRSEQGLFVAPDNGLLTYLLEDLELREVQALELFLDGPGQTFHGRDRFAPVAAHLAAGGSFEDLGGGARDPLRLEHEPPRKGRGFLQGHIVHIDRFGNLITNIPSRWWPEGRQSGFEVDLPGLEIATFASHYALLEAGQAALLPGSLGTLEISLNRESAAERSGCGRNQALRIDFR